MSSRRISDDALRADAAAIYGALRDLLAMASKRDPEVVCAWGITITECHILERLGGADPSTLNAVADHVGLDKSTASRAVASLVEKGLVRREVHPGDRRALQLKLTAKGRKTASAVAAANLETYARILRGLSATERASLTRALRRMKTLVGELEPDAMDVGRRS